LKKNFFRNYLDESKTSNPYDSHPIGTEKVRFDTEQIKYHDSTKSKVRSSPNRTTNTYRYRRQQQVSDGSLTTSPRKRTEKIRVKDALDILETYYARCKTRIDGKI